MNHRHPKAVFMQLTTRCNLRCHLCPHKDTKGAPAEMGEEVWAAVVDSLGAEGYRGQIGLYMHGEPTLARNLPERIAYARAKAPFSNVAISTNGRLLGAVGRSILEAGVNTVFIHLQTTDPGQYKDFTGSEMGDLLYRIRDFCDIARNRAAVNVVMPAFEGMRTKDLDILPRWVETVTDMWAISRGGAVKEGTSARGHKTRYNDHCQDHCFQPTTNMAVFHDGRYAVCTNDWGRETCGEFPSVMETPPVELFNSEIYSRINAEFEAGDYSRFRICGPCSEENGFRVAKR